MDTNTIAFILFIPTFILLGISIYHLKKLTAEITRVNKTKDLKGAKDFVDKSFISSDILLEVFIPKNYSKKYPKEFTKVRFFMIPAILFFIPTAILMFYIVFQPYFAKKEYGIPSIFLGFIVISLIVNIILRKNRNKK